MEPSAAGALAHLRSLARQLGVSRVAALARRTQQHAHLVGAQVQVPTDEEQTLSQILGESKESTLAFFGTLLHLHTTDLFSSVLQLRSGAPCEFAEVSDAFLVAAFCYRTIHDHFSMPADDVALLLDREGRSLRMSVMTLSPDLMREVPLAELLETLSDFADQMQRDAASWGCTAAQQTIALWREHGQKPQVPPDQPTSRILNCPGCNRRLRVPTRKGIATCPTCQTSFAIA